MNTIQEIQEDAIIGKIVANDYRAAEVFKKYGIDFCCKGNRALKDVCRDKGLDLSQIEIELLEKTTSHDAIPENVYESMELGELAIHIENTHHNYIRESIPVLLSYLTKINKVHGSRHPELCEVYQLFYDSANELTHHMVKEENIVFPAIRELVQANRQGTTIKENTFFFGSLNNPIKMMEAEHSVEGDRFAQIVELTNNYTPPQDACTTYRVAFQKLNEFMDDLHTHIHLENNILFPKALELEKQLTK